MIEDYDIEDTLCKAFIMSLGSSMPNYTAVSNMISWINMKSKEEEETLTEDYIYGCIPRYINFLSSKV
tara:strand:- start:956 stop:1159 length:204 start_codon:yes stop_codon:yes gene_type:complete